MVEMIKSFSLLQSMENIRGSSSQTDYVHGNIRLSVASHSFVYLLYVLLHLFVRLTTSAGKEILRYSHWPEASTPLMTQDLDTCDTACDATEWVFLQPGWDDLKQES